MYTIGVNYETNYNAYGPIYEKCLIGIAQFNLKIYNYSVECFASCHIDTTLN